MATISKSDNARPDAAAILSKGAYYILDRCASHEDVYPVVCEAFYHGVEELAGADAARLVRRDGLGLLHKHFPTEKVLLLEEHVRRALKDTLLYWSYRVGREDLGLADPFYVDHLIVIRIHFPYEVAKLAKKAEQPDAARADFADHAISALRNPRIIANQLSRAIRRPRGNSSYDPDQFHGALTKPARSHGAHIDTWYGHSFDGINLWWSIDGVTVDNTVILYPEMFARPVDYDEKSMYLARGQQVSEPHNVDLKPGQLLLFNPEMLHSTQVNVSDRTRVALTTRVNPHQPKFNDEAPFNFEHWHNSRDLQKRRFKALDVFPAGRHRGAPSYEERPRLERQSTEVLTLAHPMAAGPACRSGDLKPGVKVAVDFSDAKIILWRDKAGGIKAYSRLCPHVGVDLADGWHDNDVVHCPGHGLRFAWEDGQSNCDSFKLRAYHAEERDGGVYVTRTASKETVHPELAAGA
jgi:nitrite reductase/ring-hydroxylating ferredoxin subunit